MKGAKYARDPEGPKGPTRAWPSRTGRNPAGPDRTGQTYRRPVDTAALQEDDGPMTTTPNTATRLMRMAHDADLLADSYAERLSGHVIPQGDDLEVHERIAFHRGQASGFRQAAYWAAVSEGTYAND